MIDNFAEGCWRQGWDSLLCEDRGTLWQRMDQDWEQDPMPGTAPEHDPHMLLCVFEGPRSMRMMLKHLLSQSRLLARRDEPWTYPRAEVWGERWLLRWEEGVVLGECWSQCRHSLAMWPWEDNLAFWVSVSFSVDNGHNKSTYLIGWLWGLNEFMWVICSEQWRHAVSSVSCS